MIRRTTKREGATMMECALLFPLFFLLIIGTIVAAVGVFRYQEVAALARDGSRYASVRGATYAFQTGNTAATEAEIFDTIIKPKAFGLDKTKLKCKVTWQPNNQQNSNVTVELSYDWLPEAFFGGLTFTAKSTTRISY